MWAFLVHLLSAAAASDDGRLRLQTRGMSVLGGWSALSVGSGAVGWATADSPRIRAFHQMNLAWGAVDGAIAVAGLVGARNEEPPEDNREAIRRDVALQNALLLNAGLDVAYVVGGSALWTMGTERNVDRLVGWGQSIALQGGFLLVFDVTLAALHGHQMKQRWWVHPTAKGARVGLSF